MAVIVKDHGHDSISGCKVYIYYKHMRALQTYEYICAPCSSLQCHMMTRPSVSGPFAM